MTKITFDDETNERRTFYDIEPETYDEILEFVVKKMEEADENIE